MLVHLTNITSSTVEFKWTKVEQDTFGEIKRIMARDNLLAFPDCNEEFKIHADASVFQLGAVISHKGKPVAFYGRKITYAQKFYIVTEKDLLSIVETLK